MQNFPHDPPRGFAVIELIVAVAILVTLSATLLFNYGSFDRRVTVDILAHQIATWVHDAQVSAMSVRRAGGSETKFPGYGLHFDLAIPDRFIYFSDLNKSGTYDPPTGNAKCGDVAVECEKEVVLLQGNTIYALCGDAPSGNSPSALCPASLDGSRVFDIVFTRPDPVSAKILGDFNVGLDISPSPPPGVTYAHAEITVTSSKGYHHRVTIWSTGQVSVQ